jgi:NAD(P)-dependent dehydrogenase (short-subunit alcohol dehydrogenase family)
MSASKGGTAVVVGVGAERGLGAALCRRFAAEGHHVLVAGRTPEKIAQVVKTIGAAGDSAEAIAVDTTREDDLAGLFDRAMGPGTGRSPADVVILSSSGRHGRRRWICAPSKNLFETTRPLDRRARFRLKRTTRQASWTKPRKF